MPTQAYFEADPPDGDFYDCISSTAAGESPATHPAKWRRVDIPALFEPYLVSRATSILLQAEGNVEKGRTEEAVARQLLEELAYRDRNERSRLGRPRVFAR